MSAKKAKKEKSAFGPISVNIVLFVIGLCLAIWADKVTNIMSIVLGVLLLLVASYYVIDYFRDNKREDADGEIKVYKNTLVKRAADELNLDLDTYLEGPNAILFGEKLLEPIKVLSNFGKDHNNVNIISGVIDGKVVEPSVINEYASIPSMEGLLTMLAGGMIEHVKNLSIALNLYAEAKEEK